MAKKNKGNSYFNFDKVREWYLDIELDKRKAFTKEEVMKKILNQGRTDFRKTYTKNEIELTTDEKVILYCYYYMQMHYESSLNVYWDGAKFLQSNFVAGKQLVLIDIGCGPLTSGIAFLNFVKDLNGKRWSQFDYIGVDISESMLKRAAIVVEELPPSKKQSFHFQQNFTDLNILFEKLMPSNGNRSVIVNLSYVLASNSLEVDEFIKVLEIVFNYYVDKPICIIYQNPKNASLNKNWNKVKQHLKKNRKLKEKAKVLPFSFTDKTGSWAPNYSQVTREVYFNALYKNHE